MALNKHSEILAIFILVIDTTRRLERSRFWIWDSSRQLSPMSFV